MNESPHLSVVVPMYNEEVAITATLQRLLKLFQGDLSHVTFEIIVVDDGSSDGSFAQAQQVDDAHIYVYQHPYNIGNGAAVKTGIRRARGEVLLLMDADGQHAAEDIPRLLDKIGVYDMVVGARTSASDSETYRNIANKIYNAFAGYICGRQIDDLTSGFRAIKADIARGFVYLLPNTFSYPTTITLAAIRAGFSVDYVPIVAARRLGKSKIRPLQDGIRFLLIILKIATLFSPLRVFLPVSASMFLLGFFYGLFKVVVLGWRYGPTSAMLMTVSILMFLIGLVSEQVAQLRFDRSETFPKK